MRATALPSLILHLSRDGIFAERDESRGHDARLTATQLIILEAIAQRPDLEAAYQLIRSVNLDTAGSAFSTSAMAENFLAAPEARIHLDQGRVWGAWGGQCFDLLPESQRNFGMLTAMARLKCGQQERLTPLARARYQKMARSMGEQGLIAPPVGDVDLGDLRRLFPLDPFFGWNRGAPVDRYYLDRFVERLRPLVAGRCLEVGARKGANEQHKFAAETYQTLDLIPGEADLTGDVGVSELFAPEVWDSIIAFHVLEHCAEPRRVVKHFHQWLRPGGLVVAQVPAVQRIHRGPMDCVRFMPDGMRQLFQDFSEVEVSTYGNPLTVVAGVMGLSWDELTREELDFVHVEYPLVVNAVARK